MSLEQSSFWRLMMTFNAAHKPDPLSPDFKARASIDQALSVSSLPPVGASPASDLQRQLSEAVLLGFYRKDRSPGPLSPGLLAVVSVAAIVSWLMVFGLGWLIIG
jgi:hypothetical protein